jgi:hypothetical protein
MENLLADKNALAQSLIALETTSEEVQVSTEDKLASLAVDLQAMENWMLHLVPLLTQLKRGTGTSPTSVTGNIPTADCLLERVSSCEQTVTMLRDLVRGLQDQDARPFQTQISNNTVVESQLLELQAQMKQL